MFCTLPRHMLLEAVDFFKFLNNSLSERLLNLSVNRNNHTLVF